MVSAQIEQTELFRSGWCVSEHGHKWEGLRTVLSSPRLVLKNKLEGPKNPYDPLSAPTLFGDFAALEPTQDAILQFANQYGFLRQIAGPEESLNEWEHEIRSLSQAVLLWECLKNRKTNELERFFIWEGDRLTAPTMYDERTRTWREFILSDLPVESLVELELDKKPNKPCYLPISYLLKPGDVKAPARALIERIISGRLTQEVRVTFDGGKIFMSFRSLIGAMWFQFAEAVSGKEQYTRCVECNRWVRLKAKAIGKGKMYCSNRCKQIVKRRKSKLKLKPKPRTKR